MTVSIWHLMPGSWVHGGGNAFSKYVREGSLDMPDYALCRNEKCPSKDHCYRFTARPSGHQVYAVFTVPPKRDRCDYYIPAQMNLPLTPKG